MRTTRILLRRQKSWIKQHEREVFQKLLNEERQAIADHKLALRLAGTPVSSTDAGLSADYEAQLRRVDGGGDEDKDASGEEYFEAQWEIAKQLCISGFDRDCARSTPEGELVQPANSQVSGSNGLTKCDACMEMEPTDTTLHLHCTHSYCRSCLVDLFISAVSTPNLFPPKCCKQPIPLDTCRVMLPEELVEDLDLKIDELATPNPTYCANADCSKFIRPREISGDVGRCVFCMGKTCIQCKNQSHDGLCPSDPHVQLLMDFAKRSKWQQCTNCKNMVELERGCFHMTCRCKHEFCYLCGLQWKGCTCPLWDEEFLTRQTRNVRQVAAARPAPVAAAVPAPPAAAHDRGHEHSWRQQIGIACQACGATHLPWVMRCRNCTFASCWRCIHTHD